MRTTHHDYNHIPMNHSEEIIGQWKCLCDADAHNIPTLFTTFEPLEYQSAIDATIQRSTMKFLGYFSHPNKYLTVFHGIEHFWLKSFMYECLTQLSVIYMLYTWAVLIMVTLSQRKLNQLRKFRSKSFHYILYTKCMFFMYVCVCMLVVHTDNDRH